jgi:citrate lyase subunit beta / citryl-CoA lyase
MRRHFIRRSLLYVPGSSPQMINKALGLKVDTIIFDLEDAVSLREKDNARRTVTEYISIAKGTGKEVLVRVNTTNSLFGIKDILAVVPEGPDALIIPKAEEASIITADAIVGAIEQSLGWEENTVRIVPLLETVYSIQNAYKILSASKRINGVQFGAEDLTTELEIPRTKKGDELRYARSTLVFAGKTLGIDIIDSPFTDIQDQEGLIDEINTVKALGMTGKTCIHPIQISVINEMFTPNRDDVEYSKRVLEAFEFSEKQGKGVCVLDGKMIDNPVADRARKIIKKAEIIRNE